MGLILVKSATCSRVRQYHKSTPSIDKNVMAEENIQDIHNTNRQCNNSWNFKEPIISAAEETILQPQIDPFYGASIAII